MKTVLEVKQKILTHLEQLGGSATIVDLNALLKKQGAKDTSRKVAVRQLISEKLVYRDGTTYTKVSHKKGPSAPPKQDIAVPYTKPEEAGIPTTHIESLLQKSIENHRTGVTPKVTISPEEKEAARKWADRKVENGQTKSPLNPPPEVASTFGRGPYAAPEPFEDPPKKDSSDFLATTQGCGTAEGCGEEKKPETPPTQSANEALAEKVIATHKPETPPTPQPEAPQAPKKVLRLKKPETPKKMLLLKPIKKMPETEQTTDREVIDSILGDLKDNFLDSAKLLTELRERIHKALGDVGK